MLNSLLKYNQDWRCLLFLLINSLLLFLPFVLHIGTGLSVLWVIATSLFCFCSSIINHNHLHNSIFLSSWLNRLLGVVLSVLRGHSSISILLTHNDNHHRHIGTNNDWIRPELAGTGIGVIRLLRFIYKAITCMAQGKQRQEKLFFQRYNKVQLILEKYSVVAITVILLFINTKITLIFILTPWVLAVILLIAVNLLQHDQCKSQSHYNHSRNFMSPLGNWFLFNNGYHTIHHLHPSLHWSELPKKHRELVEPFIDKSLNHSSVLLYLFTHYLFAGSLLAGHTPLTPYDKPSRLPPVNNQSEHPNA